MRNYKKEGKPCRSLHLNEILEKGGKTMWRFHFFCWVRFPSQNLPQHSPFQLRTRTFQKPTAQGEAKNKPKTAPSRRLHLNETLEKRGKTMWRFHFFCSVSFPSQNLPQHGPFQLQTRTFQKNIAQGEAKNKPKAKIFQKPTPKWETIKRRENHAEAYTWMRY